MSEITCPCATCRAGRAWAILRTLAGGLLFAASLLVIVVGGCVVLT